MTEKEKGNELANFVEQYLPITAKDTMREIAIYAAKTVFAPFLQYARSLPKEQPSDPEELTKIIEGGAAALLGPGIAFVKLAESEEFFTTVKWMRESGVEIDKENLYQTEISPPIAKSMADQFGELYEKTPDIEFEECLLKVNMPPIDKKEMFGQFQDNMLHYYSMSLLLKIAATKHHEDKLLSSPLETYQSISEALSKDIQEIVQGYVSLKTSPAEFQILNMKLKESYRRSKGRKPNPLFDDFIAWAMKLSNNHGYRYPKQAARDFLRQSEKTYERVKHDDPSENTLRTMVDKLREHCKLNDLSNPFTDQ